MSKLLNVIEQIRAKYLAQNSFLQNTSILVGGTILAQVLNLLAAPIITRIYEPKELGNLSVYISMASIIGVVACLRYETAIPLPNDDETAVCLLVLCLVIVPSIAVSVGLGILLLGDQITIWINAPMLRPYMWLLPLSILGMGIYQALNYWAIRTNVYGIIAKTKFSQTLGMIMSQISLGLLGLKPVGLLIGDVLGRSIGVITMATLAWQQGKDILKTVSFMKIISSANRYRRFPLIATGANLLNSLNLYTPFIITTAFYGTEISGKLMLAQIVLGVPSALLASAISQAYFGESTKIMRDNSSAQMALFRKMMIRLFLLGIPLYTLIAIIAPLTFHVIFGEKWYDTGTYVQMMTPMFIFQFVGSPLSVIQDVLERQDLQVLAQITRIVLLFCAAFYAWYGHLESTHWIFLMSISMVAAYIISIYISYRAIKENQRLFM